MVNCEQCDYFKKINKNNKVKHICEYVNFTFENGIEEYKESEHPCFLYDNENINEDIDEVKKAV